MSDEPDPPRKFYTLKPKEFEAVNPPVPRRDAEPAGPTEARPAGGPIDVRELIKSATVDPAQRVLAKSGATQLVAGNDVHAILKENLAHANAAGLNDLTPKPRRKSKRKRDYILTMLAANPPMVALFVWGLHQHNVILLVYVGAGVILFNVSFTWVMWFVADDY